MQEIQPGLLHWTAFHEGIAADVHSYFHVPSATLLDPMEPLQGVEAVPRPERIVLTNRHHYRHSDRFRAVFGCPVLCHEAGLHEFEGAREVQGFRFGDALVRGRHGELGFVPDPLMGDDPAAIRRGLRQRFKALAEEIEFDAVLLAHSDPIVHAGRSALRTFAEAPTAGAPPG
jgi:hypothetical protein